MDSKKLPLLLFGSLAANVFLGGIVGAKMLNEKNPEAVSQPAEKKKAKKPSKKAKAKKAAKKAADARKRKGDRPPHHGGKGPPPRSAEHGPPSHGSRDLMMLRHMVKIMGGPNDPRIKELREQKKDDIEAMRSEMKEAHDRVFQALTAETPDNAELGESLKGLRKKTFEAQARAQEGIIKLHSLMTPEELASLRKTQVPGPPERMLRKRDGHRSPGKKTPPPTPPGE